MSSASRPVLIAHRGASGYWPEHTLAAYELGARMGADFIEPDLVSTADGHLVARHENDISATTDIAARPEFAHLHQTKVIDGVQVTGWFTEDLTLAELRTLRAVERLPDLRPHHRLLDGRLGVPTFSEILQLRDRLSQELGRPIGVYPETKHPTYFESLGLGLEEPLLAELDAAGLNHAQAPVFVQSFERSNLLRLRRDLGAQMPLIYLITAWHEVPGDEVVGAGRTYGQLLTDEGMRQLAVYVDGVGPHKDLVVARDASGALAQATDLVPRAHAAGLLVHPWTFRAENAFLPRDLRSSEEEAAWGDVLTEMRVFLEAGVDGFFTDHSDLGRFAIDEFLRS